MSGVREAAPEDAPQLAQLLEEYMQETFKKPWNGSIAALQRDLLGRHAHTLVATLDSELVGFSVWEPGYDVHHCVRGGVLLDLYVRSGFRGGSLAPELLLATLVAVQRAGGVFLKGLGGSSPRADALYQRFAMTFPGTEFIVGGRAFRELAALHGKPLREAVRAIPPKSANFEP